MHKRIAIVGGVAGGATTAARLRRLDEESEIVIFERGEHISFANCGLPYYIGGVIKGRDKLLVQTVKGMTNRFNLDIRIKSEVTAINRQDKKIQVKNLATGVVYEESYDLLILSPGASPIIPGIEGITDNPRVFSLRTIPDAEAIDSYIDQNQAKTAVVIGGGFIGLEMAENLKERNLDVYLVEATDQVQPSMDYEMASLLHTHLREKGVRLILKDSVVKLEGSKVYLQSSQEIEADLIVMAIGVRPESILAVQAGLEIGERGSIRVNEYLQTSDENIYAIGDAIEVKNYITGLPTNIPLAWPANRQGRLLADNLYGSRKPYRGTLGTSVAKVFDLTAASTGINEKTAAKMGIPYRVIHIHPNSHAGYYPGSTVLDMKMVFTEDGKILGAQAVGRKGAEKRIDVIATAIKGNLTVYDLQDLELAYAPPYSSGKDPVNMIGYAAANLLDHMVKTVQYHEIDDIVAAGNILVDVRQPEEVELGKINGSINIPLPELRKRLGELPKDKPVYLTCQVGLRGYIAARILEQHGYDPINLDGGFRTYTSVYWAVEKKDKGTVKVDDTGKAFTESPEAKITADKVIDCCGLQCPGPIKLVFENMKVLEDGQVLEILVTDPGFARDIEFWCSKTGNTLLKTELNGDYLKVYLRKGSVKPVGQPQVNVAVEEKPRGATLIVFEQNMDKALASFIIATGAASMGKDVTMFFTFWGLNILKKYDAPKVSKDSLAKAFGIMMPRGPRKLPISNMNMGGMGAKMIKHVMKKKNVDSLEELLHNAMKMGIKLVACSMSMDVMGIKKEELIDGVEIGGVATMLAKAEESNLNLFF
ncbi:MULTISPECIES: CoA-disulfide reductase [unclassified Dehalobacter]|uniref:CoA-disulfide reductase n=1 Tax=unclassified Dehalobacter TaxID=2635733 RepID=UPI00036C9388|nr:MULTISPECIES: CoA-disulfide reductase [unclassified Dehalobacter]RJE48832.1 pyridine nucleotide-disulfide oxidoreductase [Dehalobacter sp. MCB1]TCX51994.1 CoA-disulfide reductase [Dehalobacter sp. 14DCB1]TCX53068.1 CoA-disulfide reductase [Dehalobacter sp. 12DCB1]